MSNTNLDIEGVIDENTSAEKKKKIDYKKALEKTNYGYDLLNRSFRSGKLSDADAT